MTDAKSADLKPGIQLQPHQERVRDRELQQLADTGKSRLLLYHSLGSGKSLSAANAADAAGIPYTAVVPASLRDNFKKEQEKFFAPGSTPGAVVSYTSVGQGKPLPHPDAIVADEAQKLVSPDTAQTRNFLDLADNAKAVTLLSGTPVVNSPDDFATAYSVLTGKRTTPAEFGGKFVDETGHRPSLLGRLLGFPTRGPGIVNQDELKADLAGKVDYFAPGVPKVRTDYADVPVEMSEQQYGLYRDFMGRVPGHLRHKLESDTPLTPAEVGRLSSFMTGPREVGLSLLPFSKGRLSPLQAFEKSPKLVEALKHVQETLKNPEARALVFSNFTGAGLSPYLAALQKAGIPAAQFDGKLNDQQRRDLVNNYNTGKTRVALLGPSGTEGLSFRGTRLIQLLDPHWNENRGRQSAGRGVRFDSHDYLPENEREVRVERYLSRLPLPLLTRMRRSLLGNREGDERLTYGADDHLRIMAEKKDVMNQKFLDVLKEIGSQPVKAAGLGEIFRRGLGQISSGVRKLEGHPPPMPGIPPPRGLMPPSTQPAVFAPGAPNIRISPGAAEALPAPQPNSLYNRFVTGNREAFMPDVPLNPDQVMRNIPQSLHSRLPVITEANDAAGRYSGFLNNPQAVTSREGAAKLNESFATRHWGLGGPQAQAAGYAAPDHIALGGGIGGNTQANILRHEGYHGVVGQLRQGVPRAELPGATWAQSATAAMQNSRYGPIRALGSHADEVGARVLGEGGWRGLTSGMAHAVSPSPIYSQTLAPNSPFVSSLLTAGGEARARLTEKAIPYAATGLTAAVPGGGLAGYAAATGRGPFQAAIPPPQTTANIGGGDAIKEGAEMPFEPDKYKRWLANGIARRVPPAGWGSGKEAGFASVFSGLGRLGPHLKSPEIAGLGATAGLAGLSHGISSAFGPTPKPLAPVAPAPALSEFSPYKQSDEERDAELQQLVEWAAKSSQARPVDFSFENRGNGLWLDDGSLNRPLILGGFWRGGSPADIDSAVEDARQATGVWQPASMLAAKEWGRTVNDLQFRRDFALRHDEVPDTKRYTDTLDRLERRFPGTSQAGRDFDPLYKPFRDSRAFPNWPVSESAAEVKDRLSHETVAEKKTRTADELAAETKVRQDIQAENTPGEPADPNRGNAKSEWKSSPPVPQKVYWDQATKDHARLAAGGLGGATIGGLLPADSTLKKLRNAAIGGGLGVGAGYLTNSLLKQSEEEKERTSKSYAGDLTETLKDMWNPKAFGIWARIGEDGKRHVHLDGRDWADTPTLKLIQEKLTKCCDDIHLANEEMPPRKEDGWEEVKMAELQAEHLLAYLNESPWRRPLSEKSAAGVGELFGRGLKALSGAGGAAKQLGGSAVNAVPHYAGQAGQAIGSGIGQAATAAGNAGMAAFRNQDVRALAGGAAGFAAGNAAMPEHGTLGGLAGGGMLAAALSPRFRGQMAFMAGHTPGQAAPSFGRTVNNLVMRPKIPYLEPAMSAAMPRYGSAITTGIKQLGLAAGVGGVAATGITRWGQPDRAAGGDPAVEDYHRQIAGGQLDRLIPGLGQVPGALGLDPRRVASLAGVGPRAPAATAAAPAWESTYGVPDPRPVLSNLSPTGAIWNALPDAPAKVTNEPNLYEMPSQNFQ